MTMWALKAGVVTAFVFLAAMPSRAQTPPPPPASSPPAAAQSFSGFVSPYEIVHTLRTAGFDPLAPPLREGTTYVVRATDYRGILMRVVVDARTGAIRDANRIVPGPGRFGQLYDAPPPYDPTGYAPTLPEPLEDGIAPPLAAPPTLMAPPAMRPSTHPLLGAPPLPRPRPAALAARKADGETQRQLDPKQDAGPDAAGPSAAAKPGIDPQASDAAPPAPPAAPKKPAAVVPPLND